MFSSDTWMDVGACANKEPNVRQITEINNVILFISFKKKRRKDTFFIVTMTLDLDLRLRLRLKT